MIAKISNSTRYANANQGALKLMDPALVRNPGIYPDEATRRTLFTPIAESPAAMRASTSLGVKVRKLDMVNWGKVMETQVEGDLMVKVL